MCSCIWSDGTNGGVKTTSKAAKSHPVFQDSDPEASNYLSNRRALVGSGCTVNSLFDGVQLVSGVANLANLCNDNVDDYTTFPGLANVTAVGNPIVSVKDHKNHYAAGTEAGFAFCAKSDSKLLGLDLVKFYKIQFLCDGKAVGDLQKVSVGQDITGLGVSLIQIPGKDLTTKIFSAKAPAEFDEVKLYQCGIDASVLTSIDIKYAFVGKAREYTITNNAENGIAKYAADQGRGDIKLEAHGASPTDIVENDLTNKVIDSKLDNGYNLTVVSPITVVSKSSDGKETFPANTEVGFKYNSASLLKVDLGAGLTFTLYDKDNKKIDDYNVSTSVLSLGFISGGKDAEIMIDAPKAFSSVKIAPYGVDINLGADVVNYAFVRLAPSLASHHCPIEATSGCDVPSDVNSFTLQHNPDIDVTWSIESQPDNSNMELTTANGETTVTNMYVPGTYTFTATAKDGCTETTTINYAPEPYDPTDNGTKLLVNEDGADPKYKLSDKTGGSLVQIAGNVANKDALLTGSLTDCAYRTPGVELAANSAIVGIKTADGSSLGSGIDNDMNAGFVVSSSTALDASVLSLYNIQLLKNGVKVGGDVTSHWSAISAGLIGSQETHKMRLSIDVPKGTDFDEMVLYNSGVLAADLSQLSIYYAYVNDATKDNVVTNELYESEPVSAETTDASIDFDNTKLFSVANIGNGYNELANLIDNDLTTAMQFPMGVDLGGATIAVNIGKTVNPGQQLVLVTNKAIVGLGASLGEALKITTYCDGKEEETLNNWNVLGADIIGSNAQGYFVVNPTKPFDNVRITAVKALSALNGLQLYGLALRSDMDQDGIPDVVSESYVEDIMLDEDRSLDVTRPFDNAQFFFHRTMTKGKWNSLILPVNMSKAQFEAAFGQGAEIAAFDRLEDNCIYFKPFTDETDGVLLQKNTPYIVKPTAEPRQKATYTSDNGNKTIEGPVYVTTGISYSDETASMKHSVDGSNGKMTFYGSYENPTEVPAKSYMLNNGNMVHTAKEHGVKAYRTWLERLVEDNTSTTELTMRVEKTGTATGIYSVVEENGNTNNAVYDLNGIRQSNASMHHGVYITNGKKYTRK